MKYLHSVFITIITISCNICFESFKIANQTLYKDIVDYFFPVALQNPKFTTSNYLCLLKTHKTCCRCTKSCIYYGTCCIDAFFNNNITSVEEYVDIFSNMHKIRRHVKTLPIVNIVDISVKFKVEKHPMVASCKNTQSVFADHCNKNDSSNDIRVIADGFIYKNKFCALCHGFQTYAFGSLELVGPTKSIKRNGIDITVPDHKFTLRMREDRKLGYKKEKKFDRSCLPKLNKLNCSRKDMDLCFNSYFALIEVSKRWYANQYCATCNGETDTNYSMKTLRCSSSSKLSFKRCRNKKTRGTKPHFRLLISFDKEGKFNSVLDKGNPICFCNQYFDIYNNKCQIKLHSTCRKRISKYMAPNFQSLSLKPHVIELPLPSSLKAVEKTYQCIQQMGGLVIDADSTNKNLVYNQTNKTTSYWNHTESILKYQKMSKLLGSLGNNSSTHLILVPYKVCPYTELYGFSPKHHFLRNRVCANPEIITQNFEVTEDCNISVNNTIYDINEDAIYWVNITRDNTAHAAARCKRFHLTPNCAIGVVNTSLTNISNNSAIIRIENGAEIYTPEQFLPLMEGLGICYQSKNERSKMYMWLKQYYHFENWMSLSLLSVSIVFEGLLLIVYLVWNKVRDTPEKNLMAFCIGLLICDVIGFTLTLIKSNINKLTCKIVALLLHFFSLTLCTWPCIIAYEVWLILRYRNVKQRSSYSYLIYSVIAWGLPLATTLICLIVDLVSNGSLIRYGNQEYCWIFPFHARLAVYIVPIIITNYGSFLVISITIIRTKRQKRREHKLLAKSDRINFSKMIIKLFLLFGTAEIIGLVQIPNPEEKGESELIFNTIFGLLYDFLRSSRGIFMFIISAFSKVFEIYKDRSRTSSRVSENTI